MTDKPKDYLDYQIGVQGLFEQIKQLEKFDEEFIKEMDKGLRKAGSVVKSVEMSRIKQFTGSTSRSIGMSVKTRRVGSLARNIKIGPKSKEGKVAFIMLEKGRAPGAKMPWIHELRDWFEATFHYTNFSSSGGDASEKALFGLVRSIGLKGTKGKPIRIPVIEATRERVMSIMQEAVKKIVEKMIVK